MSPDGDQAAYQIKGSTLRTKLAYVGEHFGADAADDLRAWLEERGIRSILDSSWYPFEHYEGLLERIAERSLGGRREELATVGRDSAERALTTVYKTYLLAGSFEGFLKNLARLHSTFYNQGGMQVAVAPEAQRAEIVLSGAPVYGEADAYLAQGFYTGAAEQFQLAGIRCTWQRIDGGLRYDIRWS